MTRSMEALFWQVVGGVGVLSGVSLLLYTLVANWSAPIVNGRAIQLGIASSFVLLAGALSFFAGRSLHARETGAGKVELVIWLAVAAAVIIGAMVLMLMSVLDDTALAAERLILRFFGGSALLFGVTCLLGQRLMAHAHEAEREAAGARAHAAGRD